MLDIGWTELLVIGVVALIVVGPKDLPMMFRRLGQFVGRMRGMARDFQRAMDDAADDTGMADVKKTFDDATSLKNTGLDGVKDAMKSYQENYKPMSDTKMAEAKAAGKKTAAKDAAAKAKTAAAEAKKAEAAVKATKDAAPTKAKSAAKKTTAKKTPAKKPAAKKPAVKKTPS